MSRNSLSSSTISSNVLADYHSSFYNIDTNLYPTLNMSEELCMNVFEIVFTVINACFTLASVFCAIISVRQTRKQNKLMADQIKIAQEQLDESRKPDFPTTMRLESIANSIRQLDGTVKNYLDKQ